MTESPPRFSLGCLLIGFAVFSVVAAGLAYLGKAVYVADQAERNLIAYCAVSEALARFVDGRGRWPTNESELRTFSESLPDWSDRGIDVFERTNVAYDFNLDRDSLASETFRGLRYREPIYPGPADNARDRLLAALRIHRDLKSVPLAPSVDQASPDDAPASSGNETAP